MAITSNEILIRKCYTCGKNKIRNGMFSKCPDGCEKHSPDFSSELLMVKSDKNNMRYLCPGKNPNHYAFKLKNKKECTLDYEHGVEGGSRTSKSFKCNESSLDLDPTYKNENRHSCDNDLEYYSAYGTAVESCNADDYGRLWVGNGEYSSMVKYCPFCGFKGEE